MPTLIYIFRRPVHSQTLNHWSYTDLKIGHATASPQNRCNCCTSPIWQRMAVPIHYFRPLTLLDSTYTTLLSAHLLEPVTIQRTLLVRWTRTLIAKVGMLRNNIWSRIEMEWFFQELLKGYYLGVLYFLKKYKNSLFKFKIYFPSTEICR